MVMPSAFKNEDAALSYIKNHVALGTEINADEAASWDGLHGRYVVKRINHQLTYSDGSACTNGAESFLAAYVAPRPAITTTSLVPTWPATRKRAPSVRVIVGMTTARRLRTWRGWRWQRRLASISAVTGSAMLPSKLVSTCINRQKAATILRLMDRPAISRKT